MSGPSPPGTSWSTPPRRPSPPSSARSRPCPPKAPSSRSTWCSSGCRGCATRPSSRTRRSPGPFTSPRGTRSWRRPTPRPPTAECPPRRPPRSTATRSPTRRSSPPTSSSAATRPSPCSACTHPPGSSRGTTTPCAPTSGGDTRPARRPSRRADRRLLALIAEGRPCVEAKTPLDLERDLRLPGGHIFHGDLAFPYAEEGSGRWGVETGHANVLLCGAGAVRGGGVSGIPGHNAAMAALGQ